jgi:hypothetical protein
MKKLKAFMDIATLISAVLLVVVLGSLLVTITDTTAGLNMSRNGSAAIGAMISLIPLLIIIVVVVSFLKMSE